VDSENSLIACKSDYRPEIPKQRKGNLQKSHFKFDGERKKLNSINIVIIFAIITIPHREGTHTNRNLNGPASGTCNSKIQICLREK